MAAATTSSAPFRSLEPSKVKAPTGLPPVFTATPRDGPWSRSKRARKLRKDWSLDLNFSDSYHWSEPPILHVFGRDIALTKYAEPSIRRQLGRIRSRAREAERRLDLHDKAAKAWEQAFQPIQISGDPQVWLQIVPASAAFAGVHANAKDLSGSLELTGTVQTLVGQAPAAVTPTPLPPLGDDVSQPGTFDVLLPVRVSYDALRDKIMQVVAASKAGPIVKEMQIYPSSGKLVIGVRVAKPADTDPAAGEWFYLSGALNVDPGQQSVRISDLAGNSSLPDGSEAAQIQNEILGQLKEIPDVSYGVAYQNLLNAANERLNRPLKNGFRMEGQLSTAKLDSIQLLADGRQHRAPRQRRSENSLWNVSHARHVQTHSRHLVRARRCWMRRRHRPLSIARRHPRSRGSRARSFGKR